MPVRGFRPPNKRYEPTPTIVLSEQQQKENQNNHHSPPKCTKHKSLQQKESELAAKVGEAKNIPKLAPKTLES